MHEFKIGDWVIAKEDLFGIGKIEHITDVNAPIQVKFSTTRDCFEPEELLLWHPQEGEWCYFYNEYMRNPFLAKFSHMVNGFYKSNEPINGQIYWQNCEPFISELPRFLKDRR